MSEEPPEFHTNSTLSPLSPLPVHPPEPSNIPVLRNQIDPIFNMTSTHLATESNDPATSKETALGGDAASPSSDSSFDDAYNDQANTTTGKDGKASENVSAGDDYAMTFDSDEEGQPQGQGVSQAGTEVTTETSLSDVATQAVASAEASHEISLPVSQNAPASPSPQSVVQPTPTTINEPISEPTVPQPPHSLPADASQSSAIDDAASGGIDIQQLLDNITANAEKNELAVQAASLTSPPVPAHSSLPPRPQVSLASPIVDTPMFPAQGLFPPASSSYRPPGTHISAGAPGTSMTSMGGLPPPPGTSFSYPPQQPNTIEQMHIPLDHRDDTDDPEKRWGPEIQKLYDIFLDEERKNVTEGTWEKFPLGSRLFVGNLASEQVTKRDVFHIFHRYGRIAQISIKQAYGFVQYYTAEACQAALINQEGADLRGKKIHLEVSKPQKSHNQARNSIGGQNDRNNQNDRNKQGRNNDRQDRDRGGRDDYGRTNQRQNRDDYRPRRSLTPPRTNDRNRESHGNSRGGGRDPYGRDRRERSPPPYDHRGHDSYRERGISPPRQDSYGGDADLQIPHRDPRNVPDLQFIVVEQLNRDFVSWCENEIRSRGIKTETMFLSPRLPLDAVMQRQIVEGVVAVSQLDLRAQNTSKIDLRVFNRSAGINNVRFDDYQGLEPKIAAELVLRDRQAQQAAPPPNPYAQQHQQYSQPPQLPYQQPPPIQQAPPQQPSLAGLANLDNATLQKLLAGLNPAQQQHVPAAVQSPSVDLVGLLGMLNQQQAATQPQQQPPQYGIPQLPQLQQQQQYGGYAVQSPVNGGYAAPQQSNGQAQAQGNAQSVQNIMAALAKARQ